MTDQSRLELGYILYTSCTLVNDSTYSSKPDHALLACMLYMLCGATYQLLQASGRSRLCYCNPKSKALEYIITLVWYLVAKA